MDAVIVINSKQQLESIIETIEHTIDFFKQVKRKNDLDDKPFSTISSYAIDKGIEGWEDRIRALQAAELLSRKTPFTVTFTTEELAGLLKSARQLKEK